MNTELGAFALRQVLASTAVLGPILILIGLCYFLFNQSRRSVTLYIGTGLILTVIGVTCLYSELRSEDSRAHHEAAIEQVEVIAEEAVRK
ncbi:hypothetical protein AB1A81_06450 [Bdellovibrio bacteriovorus]|uniref:hypothetical protein n=1 Tax=Bdellovibrio bacteriovorus TaxID=959 RepID=UPI00045BE824|nr:hypothetical protein [Bdellovibrio bacteriovorus]AHZ83981.1 hypothetical protein EP01_03350 [Bdellovibrio bacteriovorus]BEV67864.1 hypothetical protein Bb109J_c1284 [Bdellovibrio bacteriovorus]